MLNKNLNLNHSTILITGVAGFIGGSLTQKLLNQYEKIHIIGIDNMNDYYDISLKNYRLKEIEKATSLPNRKFTFIKGSIADKNIIKDIFSKFCPEIVVNLAAQSGVRYSIDNPDAYIESNLIGFYNILENCRHSYDHGKSGVAHLIYASSSSIYGSNKKFPYSINDQTDHPVSLYAATKKSNELLAYAYSKLYKIPATGLRFFTVYGPAGRPDMAYFKFTNQLIHNKKIQIYNYGNCQRDFTYIDDIVTGIQNVMQCVPLPDEERVRFKIYNIGNNHPERLSDFIDFLQKELQSLKLLPENYDFEQHKEYIDMQPGDVEITYADTKELEMDFGFQPNTNLQDGLHKFLEWYKTFYSITN